MNRNEKHLYVATAIAVAGIVYGLGHWPIKVSFQHPALNNIVLTVLVFSIPFLFMALAWVTRRRLIKASLILLGIASLFPAIPIGFIAAIEAIDILESGKGGGSFEKISELPQGSRMLRLYVSNCGATCDYGLVLQEELEIPIGIKFSRKIWSTYHTSDKATMQRLSDGKIRVTQEDGATNEISF